MCIISVINSHLYLQSSYEVITAASPCIGKN